MTTVTLNARGLRPHLGGLGWVSWRQHRTTFIAVAALLGGISVLLLVHGSAMHADYRRLGLDNCTQLQEGRCGSAAGLFESRYRGLVDFVPGVLMFLPALIGAFAGGPLVARELETGTFRFAWTQGTGRTRWIVTKLLLISGALLVLAAAFTAVFTWWFDPWTRFFGRMDSGKAYELEGTVFIARTLFAFALGAFLGAILKRTVVAVAATLGIWFAVVFPSVVFLRPLIQKPIVGVASLSGDPGTRWVLDEWLQNSSGQHLNDQQINALLGAQPSAPKPESIDQMLRSHGITHMMRYQPTSRFWHFQIVETAGYGVLTLLLAAATVWWVSRRTS